MYDLIALIFISMLLGAIITLPTMFIVSIIQQIINSRKAQNKQNHDSDKK